MVAPTLDVRLTDHPDGGFHLDVGRADGMPLLRYDACRGTWHTHRLWMPLHNQVHPWPAPPPISTDHARRQATADARKWLERLRDTGPPVATPGSVHAFTGVEPEACPTGAP